MAEPADLPPRRILVVDDEEDIRVALKDLLESSLERVEVHIAEDGAAGLRHLQRARPDLIVSDFKMPGMNGLEFLQAARAFAPETPKILITAFPDLDLAVRAINDAHIENFLQKPLDPAMVVEKVNRILLIQAARHEKERALARGLKELSERLDGR
ncbi:MAG TPA: response regulator [Candidatus Thermoplasmatota archaeon]|nr:response regulator [Candidatus Thermoplasmatota archaeon]